MADCPILFSGPMVRAILEGRKAQTRRVLKLPKQKTLRGEWEATTTGGPGVFLKDGTPFPERPAIWHTQTGYCMSPGYAPGDRLWVRESWNMSGLGWNRPQPGVGNLHYRATDEGQWKNYWGAWRPSIHMPRWASRLTLTVTDVRVQRLQDISEDDARAEGVEAISMADALRQAAWTRKGDFRNLWDSLNAKRGFGWGTNPWVCAVTFTAHQRNIDHLEGA